MITEAVGHFPVVKVAGSCHAKSHETLAQPSEIKSKAKRKREDTSGDSSTNLEDSDSPPRKQSTHGGRRAGAGNYQEQDLKALLKYTEKVLPMGQQGWKMVHKKYASWANANGWPVREWKHLENKFKNVRHPWSICLSSSNPFNSLLKPRSQQEAADALRA